MSIKKLLILSAASLVAVASTASFAGGPDAMSGPMPAAPAPAMMDWTGFYAGGNIGGAIGTASTSVVRSGTTAQVLADNNANNNSLNASSAILGAQLGYNYEFQDFVFGLESNFDYMPQNTSSTTTGISGTTYGEATNSIQTNYDYTLRGRLGYSFADDTVLVYGTGGLALADLTYNSTDNNATITFAGQRSLGQTMIGWTAGGGLEWRFVPNWSVQGQYLYQNLGTESQSYTTGTGATASYTQNASLTENIVTAAINYHF